VASAEMPFPWVKASACGENFPAGARRWEGKGERTTAASCREGASACCGGWVASLEMPFPWVAAPACGKNFPVGRPPTAQNEKGHCFFYKKRADLALSRWAELTAFSPVALRLNTSEKNEIMPRRKARAEKPRLAQMLLRSGSLAGVESVVKRVIVADI